MKFSPHYTNAFNKNLEKLCKQDKKLFEDFINASKILLDGEDLPQKFKDHKLKGGMQGFYDFHLRYDVVVIRYYKRENDIIIFYDIGTHSELFGI